MQVGQSIRGRDHLALLETICIRQEVCDVRLTSRLSEDAQRAGYEIRLVSAVVVHGV